MYVHSFTFLLCSNHAAIQPRSFFEKWKRSRQLSAVSRQPSSAVMSPQMELNSARIVALERASRALGLGVFRSHVAQYSGVLQRACGTPARRTKRKPLPPQELQHTLQNMPPQKRLDRGRQRVLRKPLRMSGAIVGPACRAGPRAVARSAIRQGPFRQKGSTVLGLRPSSGSPGPNGRAIDYSPWRPESVPPCFSAACAAASRAIGTRNGLHET